MECDTEVMEKRFQLIGVGHSCLDQVCTIEHYPVEDDSTHISSISVQGGGAVATACVAASRLGVSTAFIGNIGHDMVSDTILKHFAVDGVNTDFVVRRDDCFGLQSFVMVNPATGSRTKFPQWDTNPAIEWTEDVVKQIGSAHVLHLDGTNWTNAFQAATFAKKAGVLVSLDGCSMQTDNELNKRLASLADVLIMNHKYPLRVSGKETIEEALLEMATWGPKLVAATLGPAGSKAIIDEKVVHIEPYRIDSVVDSTGAGDVFHGAFIAGHLDGMDYREALRFASAAAALKCKEAGGEKEFQRSHKRMHS